MSRDSKIEWTRSTFNPWWGCQKVSPACHHCYAERDSVRYGHDIWGGPESARRFMSDKHWREPLKWNREAQETGESWRVFCGSMCDILEDRPDLEPQRQRLWNLIDMTPSLTWLLLTKRPERYRASVPKEWLETWPAHVWAGTTVEDQERADLRIPELIDVPAAIRFLSMEPLLGEVDLTQWTWHVGCVPHCGDRCSRDIDCPLTPTGTIAWVIAGGESGPGARPTDPRWARDLQRQCQGADVCFFWKQWGEWGPVTYHAARGIEHTLPTFQTDRFEVVPLPPDRFLPDMKLGRIGKERAGRLLEAREWNQIPGGPHDVRHLPTLDADRREGQQRVLRLAEEPRGQEGQDPGLGGTPAGDRDLDGPTRGGEVPLVGRRDLPMIEDQP